MESGIRFRRRPIKLSHPHVDSETSSELELTRLRLRAAYAAFLGVAGGITAVLGGAAAAEATHAATQPAPYWQGTIKWEYRSTPGSLFRVLQQAQVTVLPTSRVEYLRDRELGHDRWHVFANWQASVDESYEFINRVPTPHPCSLTVRGSGSGEALRVRIVVDPGGKTYSVQLAPHSAYGDFGFRAAQTHSCTPARNSMVPRPTWGYLNAASDTLPLPADWSRSKRLIGSHVRDATYLRTPDKTATMSWDLTLVTPKPTTDSIPPAVTLIAVTRMRDPVSISFRLHEPATIKATLTQLSTCTPSGCGGRARVVATLAPKAYPVGPVVLNFGKRRPALYSVRVVLTDKAGNKRVIKRSIFR